MGAENVLSDPLLLCFAFSKRVSFGGESHKGEMRVESNFRSFNKDSLTIPVLLSEVIKP